MLAALLLSASLGDAPPPRPPEAVPVETASDALETSCRNVEGPRRWRVCVTRTAGSASGTVLYFLHGHGHNAENWARSRDYKARIREAWARRGAAAPIVVSVSFGGTWLLIDENSSPKSGLLDYFVSQVLPEAEKGLGAPPRRLLMGESMGGFNAAQLVLKYPGLFERAVLACPALPHLSPYASAEEKKAYKSAPGINPLKVAIMLHLGKKAFPSEAEWERSDPFVLGRTELGPGTPPLMISSGDRDQYGLEKGTAEFVDLARERGVDVSYTPLHGGHCSADPEAIATFLLP